MGAEHSRFSDLESDRCKRCICVWLPAKTISAESGASVIHFHELNDLACAASATVLQARVMCPEFSFVKSVVQFFTSNVLRIDMEVRLGHGACLSERGIATVITGGHRKTIVSF